MKEFIKYIFKEPFFHFIILGIILFLYFQLVQPENKNTKQNIQLSKYEITQLKINYKNQFKKDVTEIELQAIKDVEIFHKILLNEAQTLNLIQTDQSIKQILIKKMKFIMTNKNSIVEPTEDELFSYYKKNIDDYSIIKNLSFSHIFLNTKDIKKANSMLNIVKISNTKPQNASSFSDSFNGYDNFTNIDKATLIKEYGNYFTNKVFQLKSDTWSEPILSKYGYHLINITKKNTITPYDFNEVQDRVYKDFLTQKKENSIRDSYEKFTLNYTIKKD